MSTVEDLLALSAKGQRCELIRGNIVMMSPAGGRHGRIALRIGRLLGNHVEEHCLGVVFAAETGFRIIADPDTVRAPDVAFVSQDRYRTIEDETGYLPLAPDLAVEVISPSDAFSDVESKAFQWLEAGTRLVLVIDAQNEQVHCYRDRSRIDVLSQGQTLDASDVVPSWIVPVSDFFKQQ